MPTKKTSTKKQTASTNTDTFQVKGEELLKKVREIVNEGNVRKITILDKDNHVVLSIPLSVGVVGMVLAPALAALGAVAALVTDCTIKVERK